MDGNGSAGPGGTNPKAPPGPPAVARFPLPSEIADAPGAEGWRSMYPYFTRFQPEDDQRFWFYNSMHVPEPMPAFDTITAEVPYSARKEASSWSCPGGGGRGAFGFVPLESYCRSRNAAYRSAGVVMDSRLGARRGRGAQGQLSRLS